MGLNESILEYLQAITLQQLVDDSHNNSELKVPSISLKKSIKPESIAA
jgi:DNA-binding IscR family transcriptional regulator